MGNQVEKQKFEATENRTCQIGQTRKTLKMHEEELHGWLLPSLKIIFVGMFPNLPIIELIKKYRNRTSSQGRPSIYTIRPFSKDSCSMHGELGWNFFLVYLTSFIFSGSFH